MSVESVERVAVSRRAFLVPTEVPRLLAGALRGDPVALRRIIGARRGGRFGAMLALAAAALAVPPTRALEAVGLHLIFAGFGLATAGVALGAERRRIGVSSREYLRVASWTVAPMLALAGVARLALGADPFAPVVVALAVGHGLLCLGVARGLERS